MNYGNCKACNKLIRFDKLSLCKDCEAKFLHAVKDYIYENGIKKPVEISKATGVPIRVIEYFLKNDYLSESISEEQPLKHLGEDEVEEKLRQMALLEALKDSFKHNVEVEEKEELKGEMHFLGRKK